MSDDWKTIRVPKDVYDDAKARKEEHGVTWGEYVNPHAWHSVFDEPKDAGDSVVEVEVQDIDEVQERLGRLETIKDSYDSLHERLDSLDASSGASLDEAALAEALADYLITGENLPEKIADNLGGGY